MAVGIGALVWLATVGLASTAGLTFPGWVAGPVAPPRLLDRPTRVLHALSQCADVPLPFFNLAALAWLCLAGGAPDDAPGVRSPAARDVY